MTLVGGEALGGALEVAAAPQGTSSTVADCLFAEDVAQAGAGAISSNSQGGGLFISGRTALAVRGSTFVRDAALGGAGLGGRDGGPGAGGGIDVDFLSSLQLSDSTLARDEAGAAQCRVPHEGGAADG